MQGLYDDGFAGFRIATPSELDAAVQGAVVAVDANVLLDLYRFRAQTSHDLITVLQGLGDRLVVPHQALLEFWRHRQRAAGSPLAATRIAFDAVTKSTRGLKEGLATWAKQVGLDAGELQRLVVRVDQFADEMSGSLTAGQEEARSPASDDDPILAKLEQLLQGRVTAALANEEWEECVAEGQRRIQAEEPPGYKDATKEGDGVEGGAGDYLVWYQATRYAQDRGMDLLIVTRDEKEDWWWRQQTAFVGPRPELSLEYYRLTGGRRLFLLRPHDLLARAGVLEVEVDKRSVIDADRVMDQDDVPPEQWTVEALEALLERLDREAPVQASVLRIAAEFGGVVTREQVYELGDFSDERMLRGFTRPFKRLTEALQDEGVIPYGVPPILVPRYPDGARAASFSVPPEVPALLTRISHISTANEDGPSENQGATLHDAMREVLLSAPTQELSMAEVMREIQRRDLYRMGDGRPVDLRQIYARAKNYPHLFLREGNVLRLR